MYNLIFIDVPVNNSSLFYFNLFIRAKMDECRAP